MTVEEMQVELERTKGNVAYVRELQQDSPSKINMLLLAQLINNVLLCELWLKIHNQWGGE